MIDDILGVSLKDEQAYTILVYSINMQSARGGIFMCNESLEINTNRWARKGENEPLKIHTTEIDAKMLEIKANAAVTYPSNKQLLHPTEYCLKYHIYERVGKLKAEKNKVLRASYEGKMPPNSDIENILFYNIGTGAFSSIFENFPKQVVFEPNAASNDIEPPYKSIYRYEIVDKDEVKIPKDLIAKWDDVSVGEKLPEKPDGYYYALRKEGIANFVKKDCKNDFKDFGIKITLTIPGNPNKNIHPISVMKHLLDGVICAFHAEDGKETEVAVRERFQKNGLDIKGFFDPARQKPSLFGSYKYLTKSKGWNPEDDRLKFGWIIVKCEGKEYKMSGSIYAW